MGFGARVVAMVGQGAAKRMEGMTPASLVCLLRHAKRVGGRKEGSISPEAEVEVTAIA